MGATTLLVVQLPMLPMRVFASRPSRVTPCSSSGIPARSSAFAPGPEKKTAAAPAARNRCARARVKSKPLQSTTTVWPSVRSKR